MCKLLGLFLPGKESPRNRIKARWVLGNRVEVTDTGSLTLSVTCWLKSLTTQNSRQPNPQGSLIPPIFTFPLGPSCHYCSLTGQQPPSWSIQSHTSPLPIHFCTAARVIFLQSKSGHVTSCLIKLPWKPLLLSGLLHMVQTTPSSPVSSCTTTSTHHAQLRWPPSFTLFKLDIIPPALSFARATPSGWNLFPPLFNS